MSISTGSSSATSSTCDTGDGVRHGLRAVRRKRDSGVLYQIFATPEIVERTQLIGCSARLEVSIVGTGFKVQPKLTLG